MAWLPSIVLLAFCGVGCALLLFPKRIIQAHARLGRRAWEPGEIPDWIDQEMDPWSRFMIGSRKEYLLRGPTEPERFSKMIWYLRAMGLLLLLGTLFFAALLLSSSPGH
ncbi:MAG: hypothetical protein Kow00123_16430 [Anaerolineales bacterium]